METDLNSYIKEYLDSYIESDNPQFAVILNGKWGGGKTWFIKKYIDERKKDKNNTNKYLYVSLYGMNAISEISDSFFKELHPLLASKTAKFGGAIFRGLIKTSIQLDIYGDDKKDVSLNSELPKITEFLGDVKNYVLIFDDLERCKIQLDTVLGYINSLVEHQGCKAIIIANEGEILEGTDDKVQHAYKKIKEKLIGRSFIIEPMLESATDSFILEVKKEKLKYFLKNQAREIILEIFHQSIYSNLRLVKQSIWEFERLYRDIEAVNNSFLENTSFLKDLLSLYLALSFEIKSGALSISLFEKIEQLLIEELENEKILLKKYPFVKIYNLIFSPNDWKNFFTKGFIPKKNISETLEKLSYFRDSETPSWIKLWHFYSLKDDEFLIILQKVEGELKNKTHTKPQIILHIYCIFLSLHGKDLYSQSPTEIVSKYKNYISKANITLKEIEDFDEYSVSGWGGLGYCSRETKEFTEMYNLLKEKVNNVRNKEAEQYIQTLKLFDTMRKDTNEFAKILHPILELYYKNYNVPILKSLNVESFLETWLDLIPESRDIISNVLVERYNHSVGQRFIKQEQFFLKKLKKAITNEKEHKKGKISYLHLNDLEEKVGEILEKNKHKLT